MTMVGVTTRQSHFLMTRFSSIGSMSTLCRTSLGSLVSDMEALAFSSTKGSGIVGAVAMREIEAEVAILCNS